MHGEKIHAYGMHKLEQFCAHCRYRSAFSHGLPPPPPSHTHTHTNTRHSLYDQMQNKNIAPKNVTLLTANSLLHTLLIQSKIKKLQRD